MTMADTVAVMNHGRIDQLGSPVDLYESPSTTFVANFLGQSNLLAGRVVERDLDAVTLGVDVRGHRVLLPSVRNQAVGDDLLVGVRPEKIHLLEPGAGEFGNRLTGGVVVDASFAGVSTQYLVRMPWGAELTVFAQNLHVDVRFRAGSEVDLGWEPEHTFGLAGDATAGAELDDEAVPAPVKVG